jgi:hypothetical protein
VRPGAACNTNLDGMSAASSAAALTRRDSGSSGPPSTKAAQRKKKSKEDSMTETTPLLDADAAKERRRLESENFRAKLHLELSDPWNPQVSSAGSKIFFTLVMITIFISIISFVLESMARYENLRVWGFLEIFCVSIFTIELAMRYYAWPGGSASFIQDPLTFVDVLSVMPFYLELLDDVVTVDLRWLRILRLINLFKVVRVSSGLNIMFRSVSRSVSGLFLLTFFMLQALMIFSTLMWAIERGTWDMDKGCYTRELDGGKCSPYQSILLTLWWAITTMTTVGYGDTIPVSNAGRLVGGLAMLGGIIMLALPTTVFGAQFAEEYSTMKSDAALEKLRKTESERLDDEAELADLKAELKELRDKAQEMLPNIHKRLHTYLGPSGRATNFNRGECIMKDLKTGLIELYDFVDELSANITVGDAGAP